MIVLLIMWTLIFTDVLRSSQLIVTQDAILNRNGQRYFVVECVLQNLQNFLLESVFTRMCPLELVERVL